MLMLNYIMPKKKAKYMYTCMYKQMDIHMLYIYNYIYICLYIYIYIYKYIYMLANYQEVGVRIGPFWTRIGLYYPPEVSSMKYCWLGVFRKEYFRLVTK